MAKAKKAKAAKQLEKVPAMVRRATKVYFMQLSVRANIRDTVLNDMGYDVDEDIDKIPDELWKAIGTYTDQLLDAFARVLG